MNLNPLKLIEKWISEHGSAAILRDHLALVKEKNGNLEAEKEILRATLQKYQDEKSALESKVSELQILLEDATKKISGLEGLRISLEDQARLVQRIRQLEAMNQDVERQLRMKSIGF